jgi:hypothetical protein
MAYTTIDKPSDYFNSNLYTGNNTETSHTVGFQPDFTWLKVRNAVGSHYLFDSVRLATKYLRTNSNGAEGTDANTLKSFDSNGYTVGTSNAVNTNTETMVGWNWKAGTSFTNDASATGIGSIDSTGSVNTDAGFSIISYTGTGSVGTVAHGLGVIPKMILFKNRTTASNWLVYHEAIGNTHNLYLDATNAKADRSDTFNDTSPTSSVFTVGTADLNTSGNSIIAYCFADVKGYSKFGSYSGNGNADGPMIFTGFKPAFIMIKGYAGADDWIMVDNKRSGFNSENEHLDANNSSAESDGSGNIDFLSNGFKIRSTFSSMNYVTGQYIYMAFASNPFVSSTGVAACAR